MVLGVVRFLDFVFSLVSTGYGSFSFFVWKPSGYLMSGGAGVWGGEFFSSLLRTRFDIKLLFIYGVCYHIFSRNIHLAPTQRGRLQNLTAGTKRRSPLEPRRLLGWLNQCSFERDSSWAPLLYRRIVRARSIVYIRQ